MKKIQFLKILQFKKRKAMAIFTKIYLGSQGNNSSYHNFILSSGLKFNKVDIEMNLIKEKSNCFILSGLCLGKNEHQRNQNSNKSFGTQL